MVVLDTAARLTTTWLVSTVLNNSAVRLLRASVVCSTCRRIPNPKSPLPSETLAGDLARRPALSLFFSSSPPRMRLNGEKERQRTERIFDQSRSFPLLFLFLLLSRFVAYVSIARRTKTVLIAIRGSRGSSWQPNVRKERERNGSPCLGLLSRSLENRCPTSSNF